MNNERELLQRFDAQGRALGAALREQCHGDPELIHGVVHLYVLDLVGGLYLQKRAADKENYPGYWDTSVGGHIRFGESVAAALERECREELGLSTRGADFLGTYLYRDEREAEWVWAYMLGRSGSIDPNPDEVELGRFFPAVEIANLLLTDQVTPHFRSGYGRNGGRLNIIPAGDRPYPRS